MLVAPHSADAGLLQCAAVSPAKMERLAVLCRVYGDSRREKRQQRAEMSIMSEMAQIGGRQPIPVKVEEGKSYWWCACGLSKTQPFCDGSHKTTKFVPVEFEPTASAGVWFCACKRSSRKPMCDGSHQKL
jgi:CDGSH-type Zn-finger protein